MAGAVNALITGSALPPANYPNPPLFGHEINASGQGLGILRMNSAGGNMKPQLSAYVLNVCSPIWDRIQTLPFLKGCSEI